MFCLLAAAHLCAFAKWEKSNRYLNANKVSDLTINIKWLVLKGTKISGEKKLYFCSDSVSIKEKNLHFSSINKAIYISEGTVISGWKNLHIKKALQHRKKSHSGPVKKSAKIEKKTEKKAKIKRYHTTGIFLSPEKWSLQGFPELMTIMARSQENYKGRFYIATQAEKKPVHILFNLQKTLIYHNKNKLYGLEEISLITRPPPHYKHKVYI